MRFIQGKFVNSKKARTVEDVSKVFSKLALQGKLSAVMKLLDNESSSGLLDLSPDVLRGLHDKHPRGPPTFIFCSPICSNNCGVVFL